jgi:hypothetical protein
MEADRLAELAMREFERIPVCDAPSCIDRAAQRGAQCPHGRKLPRESKPKQREARDWSTATGAEVGAEMRRIGAYSR